LGGERLLAAAQVPRDVGLSTERQQALRAGSLPSHIPCAVSPWGAIFTVTTTVPGADCLPENGVPSGVVGLISSTRTCENPLPQFSSPRESVYPSGAVLADLSRTYSEFLQETPEEGECLGGVRQPPGIEGSLPTDGWAPIRKRRRTSVRAAGFPRTDCVVQGGEAGYLHPFPHRDSARANM